MCAMKAVTASDNNQDYRVNSARHQKQLHKCERYFQTLTVNAHNAFNAKCFKENAVLQCRLNYVVTQLFLPPFLHTYFSSIHL